MKKKICKLKEKSKKNQLKFPAINIERKGKIIVVVVFSAFFLFAVTISLWSHKINCFPIILQKL